MLSGPLFPVMVIGRRAIFTLLSASQACLKHKVLHSLSTLLELLALWLAVGSLSYRYWILPMRPDISIGHALERVLLWSLPGLGGAALLSLIFRTAEMSGRAITDLGPVLAQVLLETHYGSIWLIRMGAILSLCGAAYMAMHWRKCPDVRYLMAPVLLVIVWTHSATGHAADQGDFTLAQCIDGLHILATSVWGGGLLVFTLCVRTDFIQDTLSATTEPVIVALSLSRMAMIALGGVLATGLYNACHQLGAPAALWESTYGIILIIKLALVLCMVSLGAFNRYLNLPRMQATYHDTMPVPAILRQRFALVVSLETLIVIGVLICAILLAHEPSPA